MATAGDVGGDGRTYIFVGGDGMAAVGGTARRDRLRVTLGNEPGLSMDDWRRT